MNISKRWNNILSLLGIATTTEVVDQSLNGDQMDTIEHELDLRSQHIASLQNRVVTLETENARLAAVATQTEPKEDPSVTEAVKSSNQLAYMADVEAFK